MYGALYYSLGLRWYLRRRLQWSKFSFTCVSSSTMPTTGKASGSSGVQLRYASATEQNQATYYATAHKSKLNHNLSSATTKMSTPQHSPHRFMTRSLHLFELSKLFVLRTHVTHMLTLRRRAHLMFPREHISPCLRMNMVAYFLSIRSSTKSCPMSLHNRFC